MIRMFLILLFWVSMVSPHDGFGIGHCFMGYEAAVQHFEDEIMVSKLKAPGFLSQHCNGKKAEREGGREKDKEREKARTIPQ